MYYKINVPDKMFVVEAPSLAYATYFYIENSGYESLESENPKRSFFSVEPIEPRENLTVKKIPYQEALKLEMEKIKEEWYKDYCENMEPYSWCESLDDVCPILELDDIYIYPTKDNTLWIHTIDGQDMPLSQYEALIDLNI